MDVGKFCYCVLSIMCINFRSPTIYVSCNTCTLSVSHTFFSLSSLFGFGFLFDDLFCMSCMLLVTVMLCAVILSC